MSAEGAKRTNRRERHRPLSLREFLEVPRALRLLSGPLLAVLGYRFFMLTGTVLHEMMHYAAFRALGVNCRMSLKASNPLHCRLIQRGWVGELPPDSPFRGMVYFPRPQSGFEAFAKVLSYCMPHIAAVALFAFCVHLLIKRRGFTVRVNRAWLGLCLFAPLIVYLPYVSAFLLTVLYLFVLVRVLAGIGEASWLRRSLLCFLTPVMIGFMWKFHLQTARSWGEIVQISTWIGQSPLVRPGLAASLFAQPFSAALVTFFGTILAYVLVVVVSYLIANIGIATVRSRDESNRRRPITGTGGPGAAGQRTTNGKEGRAMARRARVPILMAVFLVFYATGILADSARDLRGAVRANDIEKVKALLDSKDVDVNAVNKFGQTALHIAASRGYQEIVKMLISSGANVNAKDEDGKTPLHLAAKKGQENAVRLLVAAHADTNAKDKEGRTPLATAKANGRKNVIALLAAGGKAPAGKSTLKVLDWRIAQTVEASHALGTQRIAAKKAGTTFLVVSCEMSANVLRWRRASPGEDFAEGTKLYVERARDFAVYLADGKRVEGVCFRVDGIGLPAGFDGIYPTSPGQQAKPGMFQCEVVFAVSEEGEPVRLSYLGRAEISTEITKQ